MKRIVAFVSGAAGMMALFIACSITATATNYGSGAYGACQYQSCSISLSSSGTVNLPITPGGGTTCTAASDTAIVSTGSSTGYTLQLSTSDATNTLTDGTNTIPAVSGTQASPAALSANTWGYRVDGVGGFGAGPTSGGVNTGVPSELFASVPVLASPSTIANTSAPATSEETDVWYGMCANAATQAGTYSDTVTYTAMVN